MTIIKEEPWSKFFWSDYDADEGLRLCSLAAQGLWMRMLCLMARATPKGELRVGGKPCSVQDLARSVSESDVTVQHLLKELEDRGVYSVTRVGVIFCRRMRKDAEISRKRAEAGRKGGIVSHGKINVTEICSSKSQANKEAKSKPQKPEAIFQRDKIPERANTALRAPPRDDVLLDLRKSICDAFLGAGQPIPPDTGRAAVWIAQGYSPELCLAVIKSRLPAAKDKGLPWFDRAIAEAAATKAPPPPPPGEEEITYDHGRKVKAKDLIFHIKRWLERKETWRTLALGPPPDESPFLRKFAAERGISLAPVNAPQIEAAE